MKRSIAAAIVAGLLMPLALLTLASGASAQLLPEPCPTESASAAGPAGSRSAPNGLGPTLPPPLDEVDLPGDDESSEGGCYDLAVDLTDSPDPVAVDGEVIYTALVSNAGPGSAVGLSVWFESDGELLAWSGQGWDCSLYSVYPYFYESYDCTYDEDLAADASAPALQFLVASNGASEGGMIGSAYVSGCCREEIDHSDNEDSEETEVSEGAGGSAGALIPPEGGTVSTCPGTGTTTSDDTCAELTFPPGPGGIALIVEHPEGLGPCPLPVLEAACMGSAADYIVPPGYTKHKTPIVARLEYDVTVADGGPYLLFVEKDVAGVKIPVPLPVFKCHHSATTKIMPCIRTRTTDGDGDLRWTFAFLSGDPKFQGIQPVKTAISGE